MRKLIVTTFAVLAGATLAAQEALSKYFDARAAGPIAAQGLLRQVQASNVAIEMPTLSDSLNAVRNYKSKP